MRPNPRDLPSPPLPAPRGHGATSGAGDQGGGVLSTTAVGSSESLGSWPGCTVRQALSDDATIAAEIYVDSSNAAFGAWQPPMEADEARVSRWRKDLATPSYRWWIAEVNGRAVGVAGIGPSRDPEGEGIGELDTIAVLPAWWRHGIGRALVAVANDRLDLDGYERAVLWTWADYPAAAAFYPSVGWTRTQTYRDGDRQVCYSRMRPPLRD